MSRDTKEAQTMKAPLLEQAFFKLPRIAMWRRDNAVMRRRLPLRVVLQVLLFGQVHFGSW